jgi:hypothetical protein
MLIADDVFNRLKSADIRECVRITTLTKNNEVRLIE